MILNHKAAIEFLVESPDELGFNRYTFLNLHAVLTDGLLRSSEGGRERCAHGRWASADVFIIRRAIPG
jgi:hypothetical protein